MIHTFTVARRHDSNKWETLLTPETPLTDHLRHFRDNFAALRTHEKFAEVHIVTTRLGSEKSRKFDKAAAPTPAAEAPVNPEKPSKPSKKP